MISGDEEGFVALLDSNSVEFAGPETEKVKADLVTLKAGASSDVQSEMEKEMKAALIEKKEAELSILLANDLSDLTRSSFWRWICKIKSLHGSDAALYLIFSMEHAASTEDPAPMTGIEKEDMSRTLDPMESATVASLFQAFSCQMGEEPPVVHKSSLGLAHGGDKTGLLRHMKKEQATVDEFTAYWVAIKQRIGGGRTKAFLSHLSCHTDVLQRTSELYKEGDTTMLDIWFRGFFEVPEGSNEIKTPDELKKIWSRVAHAWGFSIEV